MSNQISINNVHDISASFTRCRVQHVETGWILIFECQHTDYHDYVLLVQNDIDTIVYKTIDDAVKVAADIMMPKRDIVIYHAGRSIHD